MQQVGELTVEMDILANLDVDQLDRDIIGILRVEPRTTNRAISAALSLHEVTVAARIQGLMDRNILRVVAKRNFLATGLNALAVLDIQVGTGSPQDIAHRISMLHGSCTVLVMPGRHLVVYFAADNLDCLARTIIEDVSHVKGVERITTSIIHRCIKWFNEYGDIHADISHEYSFSPRDELNEAIFRHLFRDARIGNSEIARQLSVSEGTVRKRIKQLESAGMIKFTTLFDSEVLGVNAFACVKMRVMPDRVLEVGQAVAQYFSANVVGLTLGQWDVIVFCGSISRERLMDDINNGFAQIEGVITLEIQEMVSTASHISEFYLEI